MLLFSVFLFVSIMLYLNKSFEILNLLLVDSYNAIYIYLVRIIVSVRWKQGYMPHVHFSPYTRTVSNQLKCNKLWVAAAPCETLWCNYLVISNKLPYAGLHYLMNLTETVTANIRSPTPSRTITCLSPEPLLILISTSQELGTICQSHYIVSAHLGRTLYIRSPHGS